MAASYPAAIKSFEQEVNKATLADADDFNAATDEISAIETELGTDPAGTEADVKTRFDREAHHTWSSLAYSGGLPVENDGKNTGTLDDDGTGLIGINFTSAIATNNFATVGIAGRADGGGDYTIHQNTIATTDIQIGLRNTGSLADIAGSIAILGG